MLAKLEVILNESDIIVLNPARIMQREACSFLLRQTKQETSKGVAGVRVAWRIRSLEIGKSVARRRIEVVMPGKLRVSPFKPHADGVSSFRPCNAVCHDQ